MEVFPETDRPDEGLSGAAPGTSPDGPLREHEPRLVGSVYVTVVVPQFLSRFYERDR